MRRRKKSSPDPDLVCVRCGTKLGAGYEVKHAGFHAEQDALLDAVKRVNAVLVERADSHTTQQMSKEDVERALLAEE